MELIQSYNILFFLKKIYQSQRYRLLKSERVELKNR